MEFLADLTIQKWFPILLVLAIVSLSLAVGVLLRKVIFSYLIQIARRTKWKIDEVLIYATRRWLVVWTGLIGLYIVLRAINLPERFLNITDKVLLILVVLSVTLVLANIAARLVRLYGEKIEGALAVTSLTQSVTKLVIIILGLLILLNGLGISITPILTAFGLGGLAVALALQDTLSNLFAGFYVTLSKHIRVGDYIKLETGEHGYVTDIGWRSTTIRMIPNNLVIIPNAKLAQSIITNFYLPERKLYLLLEVGVSYDSDPDKVEKILVEEAQKAVGEVKGLLGEPAPFVRFMPGFGDFSLDFTLYCQVEEFTDQYQVQHELRKRIFKRFQKEGIEIPFPVRTVHLKSKA